MVLYLLAVAGIFHTQALHATIQLWGERGACHLALPGSMGGWALPHSSAEGPVPFLSQHQDSCHCPVISCPAAPLLRVLAGM